MRSKVVRAAFAAALLAGVTATAAWADAKDYKFQLVDQQVKQGEAVISVKLIHKPSGRTIPGAGDLRQANRYGTRGDGRDDRAAGGPVLA